MTDLEQAALKLAKEGMKVFPVGLDKKPRNSNGFHGATDDPEKISAWNWNGGGAIGAAIPQGCIVVDIDPRNGGEESIKALVKGGCTLPPTRVVTTKNKGTHRYYRLPADVVRVKGTLCPGVDIKAHGKGYVLVPPSPGYTLKFDSPIADAPQWLVDEISLPEFEPLEQEGSPPKFLAFQHGTSYGLSALEDEKSRLLNEPEGNRNNTLNKAAFSLAQLAAGGELSAEYAITMLDTVAHQIGLDKEEIQETISSGWEAGFQEPRQAPQSDAPKTFDQFVIKQETPDSHYWLNWQIEEPPPPFYLHPIVPKHAYVLVYGATESSKSMVFLSLAAEGSHRNIKTSIYSLENPSHIDRDRARRVLPNPENFRITNQPIDINDALQLNDLIERNRAGGLGSWEDGRSTDWLMIDTYSHAFHSRSEDGNAKAIEFARRIRYVMHEVGCTIILIDHTGYQQHDEPRDASAKRQQVDVALMMEKVGVWSPGEPARFSITNKKSARFGNPFFLRGEIRDTRPEQRGLELRWILGAGDKPPTWSDD